MPAAIKSHKSLILILKSDLSLIISIIPYSKVEKMVRNKTNCISLSPYLPAVLTKSPAVPQRAAAKKINTK